MSNTLGSYTKKNHRLVSIFTGIGLLIIMTVLTVKIVNTLVQEVVIQDHLEINEEKGFYHFHNDSVDLQIAIPNLKSSQYYLVYDIEKKEFNLKPQFYPYSEFIPTLFLSFMLLLNYWFYKIRMKSDRP